MKLRCPVSGLLALLLLVVSCAAPVEPPLVLAIPAPGVVVVGQPLLLAPQVQGGVAPLSFALDGAAPPGLALDARTGVLQGLPLAAGEWTSTLTVTDSGQPARTASAPLALRVVPALELAPAALPDAVEGVAYAAPLPAPAAEGARWHLRGGALPRGLGLEAEAGSISGTPEETGLFGLLLELSVSTPASQRTSVLLLLRVWAPVTAGPPLPPAVAGQPYTAALQLQGGRPPFTTTGTGLPTGWTLAPGGALAGTAPSSGPLEFTVTAQDSATPPQQWSGAVSLQVVPPLAVSWPAASAVVGRPVDLLPRPSGGVPPYRFGLDAPQGLPPGLVFDASSGRLAGTPTSALTASLTLTVWDSGTPAQTQRAPLTLVVAAPLALAGAPLPAATRGLPYAASLGATGGLPPLTFSATGLPVGLQLSPQGALQGTPLAVEVATVDVVVEDAAQPPQRVTGRLTVEVQERPVQEVLVDADDPRFLDADDTDDGPALRAAVEAAARAIPAGADCAVTRAVVRLPRGTLRVAPPPRQWDFAQRAALARWRPGANTTARFGPEGLELSGAGPLTLHSPESLGIAVGGTPRVQVDFGPTAPLPATLKVLWGTFVRTVAVAGQRTVSFSLAGESVDAFRLEASGPTTVARVQVLPSAALTGIDATIKSLLRRNIITLSDSRCVTVRGQVDSAGAPASELLHLERFGGFFRFTRCAAVEVQHVRLDFETPPYTQGTVTAVGTGTFDFLPDPGYEQVLSAPPTLADFAGTNVYGTAHEANHLLKADVPWGIRVTAIQPLSAGQYRMSAPWAFYLTAGDRFVLVNRSDVTTPAFAYYSSDGAVLNATVHTAAGPAVFGYEPSGLLLFDRLRVAPRAPGRLISTAADGVLIHLAPRGPIIRNSHFEAMHDDGVNFSQPYGTVLDAAAGSLTVSGNFAGSETLQLWNPATGGPAGRVAIDAATRAVAPGGGYTYAATPESGVTPAAGQLYTRPARTCPGFRIEHSVFRGYRGHGARIMCVSPADNPGVIQGNTYENLAGPGLLMSNVLKYFQLGPPAEHVRLKGNTYRNVNFLKNNAGDPLSGALVIRNVALPGAAETVAPVAGPRNIVVEDNLVEVQHGNGVTILGAEDVTFAGTNTVRLASAQTATPWSAVHLDTVARARLEGLVVDTAASPVGRAVYAAAGVTEPLWGSNTFLLPPHAPEFSTPSPRTQLRFDTGVPAGWVAGSGAWTDGGGTLRQTQRGGPARLYDGTAVGQDLGDTVVQVAYRVGDHLPGASVGLVFRAASASVGYSLEVVGDLSQVRLMRQDASARTTLASVTLRTQPQLFTPGAWHRLRLHLRAGRLEGFLDGTRVFGEVDPTPLRLGGAGVLSSGAEVEFDDLVVQ